MNSKVIVIGSPGSGKSTFSRKLRDITGLPLYHLDMINHKPDRTTVTREEFDSRLDGILSCGSWLIDGNYQRTIEKRIKACGTVFLLDYPLEVCLSGAEERTGKKREDMPWVETELDPEFRQFIIDFQTAKLPEIYTLMKKYSEGREIIVFHSRQESEEWLKKEEEKCQK
ncbi:MAG: adenylate kinase [Oscillospiraceae bacterium]|nr:adenylate kinase [Oscillospiraceae bacterium]